MATYRDDLDMDLIAQHYNRPVILKLLAQAAQQKEVVGSFGGTGYSKRPDTLIYEQDVMAQVNNGVTSFHVSEETWTDPLRLRPSMSKRELNELRVGWDLIIDIDCVFLEYSKIAAELLVQALRHYNIQSISVKFSGNHGFHIGIPFEAMPEFVDGKHIKSLFPEAPRAIAELLKEKIEPLNDEGKLAKAIIAYESKTHTTQSVLTEEEIKRAIIQKIQEKTAYTFEELTKTITQEDQQVVAFNAFKILEVDTILISPRHLYRMPYSVNEKSGLVSIPINPDKILAFEPDMARIEHRIISRYTFLDRTTCVRGECTTLLRDAFDLAARDNEMTEDSSRAKRKYADVTDAIPEVYFAPMIKKLLEGNLNDGRKRALFVLAGFLVNVGWSKEDIEQRLFVWNRTHPEPLREGYVKGQLKHIWSSKVLPPNFSTIADYFGYDKSELPKQFKNPINYAKSKYRVVAAPVKESLSKEQKQKRKAYRDKMKALEKK